jgi:hypothetical protein
MKNFKDIYESDDKKKSDKKKPENKLKPGEGEDDKKYMKIMSDYKVARRGKDQAKAKSLLKKAMKLAKEGDVSDNAKVGAAYL